MINSVTVTNDRGESIKLELRFPEKSGFLVKDIRGLGPTKADINSTDLSTMDGSIYNSARLNSRNITITLKLMDNPTVETMRQLSYKYFPIKKRIKLLIETDNRTCETYGYVEANEPVIFSDQQTTQISIICPDPYLYSTGNQGTITAFSGIVSMFQFPFSNESTTENLIVVGSMTTDQDLKTIVYEGDSEIGINIFIHATSTATDLTIYNPKTMEIMKIDNARLIALTGYGIKTGDDIVISTIKGQKSITLTRDGNNINILNCLDRDVDWFQLSRGDNPFTFYTLEGANNLQFRIENQTVYEGV